MRIVVDLVRYLAYLLFEFPLLAFSLFYILSTRLLLAKLDLVVIAIGLLIFSIVGFVLHGKRLLIIICIAVLALTFAFYRVDAKNTIFQSQVELFDTDQLEKKEFHGLVISDPKDRNEYREYRMKVPSEGGHYNLLVRFNKYPKYGLGSDCSFKVKEGGVATLSEGYRTYLESKDIVGVYRPEIFICEKSHHLSTFILIRSKVYDFKVAISNEVESMLVEPHASLLLGMIFGDARLFDDQFNDKLRVTGTSHIIAASGFNVAILSKIVDVVLGGILPKRLRTLLAFILIWLFAAAADFSGSILRATLMLSIFLTAKIFGRVYRIFEALCVTALLLSLIHPKILLDVGFLLSIGATLGLILLSPVFDSIVSNVTARVQGLSKRFVLLTDELIPTLSCTFGTIPISFIYFGSSSFLGILPNLLLLQLVEFIYFAGIGTILVHFIIGGVVSRYIFWLLFYLLDIFLMVINLFDRLFENGIAQESAGTTSLIITIISIPILLLMRFNREKKKGLHI